MDSKRKPIRLKPLGLEPIAASNLKHNVSEVLLEAILTGKILPGERMNESHLSRQLQVSRAPIREALHQLAEQGVVVDKPRRGMFVVQLEDDDINKINSIRVILEAEAFRLARANLTSRSLTDIERILRKLEASAGAPSVPRIRLDHAFHRAVWALSGNEYLERTLNGLVAPVFAQGALRTAQMDPKEVVILTHRPFVDFLKGKSTKPAEELIADHLRFYWRAPDRLLSGA